MAKTIDLKGKVAMVTGAKQGIGKGVAIQLAMCGADVVIADLVVTEEDEVCRAVREQNVRCLPVSMNVADPQAVEAGFQLVREAFGTLDLLVNNAGITKDAMSKKMTVEQFTQVIDVNLVGSFLCAQQAMAMMRESGKGGQIVNFSSMVGVSGNIGQANYSASKAGVIGMTKSLAMEGAKDHIRVNAVAPGFIETPMTAAMPEKLKAGAIERIPLHRLGQPEDVANLVIFLGSELSDFITGQCIHINGGRYM